MSPRGNALQVSGRQGVEDEAETRSDSMIVEPTARHAHHGATADEWLHFDLLLGLTEDLLPVVSNPAAQISPRSTVKEIGKTPSKYNSERKVAGLTKWTALRATGKDIERWATERDYGICLQARTVRALDIDITDAQLAAEVRAFIQSRLALSLPCRWRANSSKLLLAFTLPGKYEKRKILTRNGAIEFLATGQQFVAVGRHPSGAHYEWEGGLPSDFPALPAPVFESLWAALAGRFAVEPAQPSAVARSGEPSGDLDRMAALAAVTHDTMRDLRSALGTNPVTGQPWIDASNYDKCIAMGEALKSLEESGRGDEAQEMWLNFLALDDSFLLGTQDMPSKWDGFTADRTDFRAVFAEATRGGWINPKSLAGRKASAAAVFDEILGTIKGDAARDPDSAASLSAETLERISKAGMTGVQEELLLKSLKAVTGVRLAALRTEVARLKKRGADEDEEAGTTHADYAKRLLVAIAAEAGDRPPVGVEGAIYAVGPDAVWRGRQAGEFEVQVGERFSGQEHCHRRSDYTGIAMHAYAIAAHGNADFFVDAPVGMACPDGSFYRVEADGTLSEEALMPEHRQRFIVGTTPIDTPTPLFDRFLEQTFTSEIPGECEAQIGLLQEVMGAAALGLMARHEKAVLLYGPGRAGKGTVLKILEALVPKEWRTAVTPFRWNSEYYIANLAGKRLNVVGELPEDMPIPAADFKTVTGRDLLAGRDPGGRPFTFRNDAAHVFNSNYLINTRDHSDAFFSRWLVLSFVNSRLGAGDAAIEVDLAERIVRDELPGVLWWALQGACRLAARGRFQATQSHGDVMAKWRRRTDSLLEFLHDGEVCELKHGDEPVKRAVVYSQYVNWCMDAGRKPMGKHRLFEALESPQVKALGVRVRRHAVLREVVDGLLFVGSAAEDM